MADPVTRIQYELDAMMGAFAEALRTTHSDEALRALPPRDRADQLREAGALLVRGSKRVDDLVDEFELTAVSDKEQLEQLAKLEEESRAATAELRAAREEAAEVLGDLFTVADKLAHENTEA